MPAIPAAQFAREQIIREVGDPNGTVLVVLKPLWDANASHVDARLQVLYTKRACLDIRLAEEQSDTDFKVANDVEDKQSQRFAHLQQMRDDVQGEIVRIETIARTNRAPKTGTLTTLAPIAPPFPDSADANDPIYRGSPYRRIL